MDRVADRLVSVVGAQPHQDVGALARPLDRAQRLLHQRVDDVLQHLLETTHDDDEQLNELDTEGIVRHREVRSLPRGPPSNFFVSVLFFNTGAKVGKCYVIVL